MIFNMPKDIRQYLANEKRISTEDNPTYVPA